MIICAVKTRTSLAAISQKYGFSNWHPIWDYNTKVRKNLLLPHADAPIEAGTKIFIPLTAKQYDHLIETLSAMRKQVQDDMMITLHQLEEAKRSADKFGAGVDFTADIATIFCGTGLKVVRFTGIVRRQALEKAAIETLQKTTAFLGHHDEEGVAGETASKAGEALAKQALRKKVSNFARATSKDFASGVTEIAINHFLGEVAGLVATYVLEGAEAAMNAVHPSKVAQFVLRLKTGEYPEVTYKRTVSMLQTTANHSLQRLNFSIKRLKNEKVLVYGSAISGTNLSRSASGGR